MSARLGGKVAFITGAARGQGRSHALRLAEEGADIIGVDLCAQIDGVDYPMASRHDLDETITLVEKAGRRMLAYQADVREFQSLQAVVSDAVAQLGRLDIIVANAGIGAVFGAGAQRTAAFTDAIDVMLTGAYHTVEAGLPALLRHGEGGSIVIVSSSAALKAMFPTFQLHSHGAAGYTAAKAGVVGLMLHYARTLAEKNIRVNTIHPGNVATPMILNDVLEQAAQTSPEWAAHAQSLLPVTLLEPSDISEAVIYLCSDSGRYVTGVALPVDGGMTRR